MNQSREPYRAIASDPPAQRRLRSMVPGDWVVWPVRLLALAAFSIVSFLTWISFRGSSVPGCGFGGLDCDYVLASRWSKWFGIPISVGGLLVYAAIFGVSWLLTQPGTPRRQTCGWLAILFLSLLAAGSGLWFTALQIGLGEFCVYCLLTHFCGVAIAGFVIAAVPFLRHCDRVRSPHAPEIIVEQERSLGPPHQTSNAGIRISQFALVSGLVFLGLVTLVAGQLLSPHETFQIEPLADAGTTTELAGEFFSETGDDEHPTSATTPLPLTQPSPANASHEVRMGRHGATLPTGASVLDDPVDVATISLKPVVRPQRWLTLIPSRPPMNMYDYPVMGNREATHCLIKIMDYTCKHCREMHHHLETAQKRYGRQIAVVILPAALSLKCNKHAKNKIEKDSLDHKDACYYAHLAIAVQEVDETKFSTLHRYLMAEKRVPPVSEAVKFAADLVGTDALRRELKGAAVRKQLHANHDLAILYSHRLPILILAKQKMNGYPKTSEEMCQVLEKVLGVKPLD